MNSQYQTSHSIVLKTRPKSDIIDLLEVYLRKHKPWNETFCCLCNEPCTRVQKLLEGQYSQCTVY